MAQVVKLTFENESGKYKFFTTSEVLDAIMNSHETFTTLIVDAKTGEKIIHKDKITESLELGK